MNQIIVLEDKSYNPIKISNQTKSVLICATIMDTMGWVIFLFVIIGDINYNTDIGKCTALGAHFISVCDKNGNILDKNYSIIDIAPFSANNIAISIIYYF